MKITYKIDQRFVVFGNMAASNQVEYSGVGSYNTTHYLGENDILCTIKYKQTERK
jgi:hypothetical protein